MPLIYNYLNYRLYLNDFFEEEKGKSDGITKALLMKKMNISSSGFLTNVLAERSNLTKLQAEEVADYLSLGKYEKPYFLTLVEFNQAKSIELKNELCDELYSIRKLKVKNLDDEQLSLFTEWYYVVIRELVNYISIKDDYKFVAKQVNPSIRPHQAKKAIKSLEKAGLIKQNDYGYYEQVDKHISAAKEVENLNIANFQLKTMDLAKRAFEKIDFAERDISTMSMTFSSESYKEAVTEIQRFRKRMAQIAKEEQNADQVYQCNIQLFPLSKRWKDGKSK